MTNKNDRGAITMTDQASRSGSLLVFVLGAPCSGKSTLCAALAKRYSFDHFSLGDELRSLVSDEPSGHAARIKAFFSDSELDIFRSNLYAGTLGPVYLTPKYVKERVFPARSTPNAIRILIDGFPRDAQRWVPFKEFAEPHWTPGEGGLLNVLGVQENVALERFKKRGRPGDVFKRRFEEHANLIDQIVDAMKKDDMLIRRVDEGDESLDEIVESLAELLS